MPFNTEHYSGLLTTNQLGQRVEYRESTTSTMDDARDIVADEPGVTAGFACVAGRQLSGRGRLGRQWISDPDLGLYVTFFIKPRVQHNAPMITLAAALAVAEAAQAIATNLEDIGGGEPTTEQLLAAIANALEPRLAQVDDEPQRVLDDWRARLSTLGQRVTVSLAEGPISGDAIDLGQRGELIVREENGALREISAGDVVIPGATD